jgi:hypothetical protein
MLIVHLLGSDEIEESLIDGVASAPLVACKLFGQPLLE